MKSAQEEREDERTCYKIREWLKRQGQKGGEANTPAQQEARLENLKKAQEARANNKTTN